MFITSSFFNSYAYKQIAENEKAHKIEWYGRYELLKLLNQLIPETMLKYQVLSSLPKNIKICPKCNKGVMILRQNGTTGQYFNACAAYCGHTESIKKY
jgi:restriction system protein